MMATEVANEGNALVCGGLSPVPAYIQGKGEKEVRREFSNQVDIFIENKVDFVMAEVRHRVYAMQIFSGVGIFFRCLQCIQLSAHFV